MFPAATSFFETLKLAQPSSAGADAPDRSLLGKLPRYVLPLLATAAAWALLAAATYLADLTIQPGSRGEGYAWLWLAIAPVLYVATIASVFMLVSGFIRARRR